jgi:hypothetical protein
MSAGDQLGQLIEPNTGVIALAGGPVGCRVVVRAALAGVELAAPQTITNRVGGRVAAVGCDK